MSMTEMEHDQLVQMYLTVWWKKTRSAIIYRFVYRAGRLLELVHGAGEINEELSSRIDAEIDHVITEAIGRPWRIHTTRRQRAIWDAAKSVCPDRRALLRLIKKDKAVRGFSTVAPEPALAQILKGHLDVCRREVIGQTEHEERVWRKLLRVSEGLITEYQTKQGTPPWHGYRCSSEHFRQIRARILLDMQDDELIAKIKLSTIDYYFGRFCDECRDFVGTDVSDPLIGGGPWEYNAEDLLLLKACIEKLDNSLRDVIDAEFFQDRKVISIKPDHSCIGGRGEKHSDGEFERLRREALRQLRICFGERK